MTEPRELPLTFHFVQVDGPPSPVVAELLEVCTGRNATDTEMLKAEVYDRIRVACLGRLGDPEQVKAIAQDPNVWEIRWENLPGVGSVRLYVAEPPLFPGVLLALHVHRKLITGTDEEKRADQNAAIAVALRRYGLGRANRWGIS